jgi:AAA domain, putative AbiEii toxin, Type IV TA system
MIAHTPRRAGRMECAMLRDLTIKNYRCFKDFSIDGLARVNLIVGQNNSGRTSFLEAVYLLVNQQNPRALIELLDNRGEYSFDLSSASSIGVTFYDTAHVFHKHNPQPQSYDAGIAISSQADTPLSVQIGVNGNPNAFSLNAITSLTEIPSLELRFTYAGVASAAFDLLADYSYPANRRFSRVREVVHPYRFVGINVSDFEYLSALWESVSLDPGKEALLVQALRLIDPTVEDVRLTPRRTASGTVVGLRDQPQRIPLSSMGEGMRRILSLAMSAIVAQGGILLVDEIDTGLYYGLQADLWRLLIETAQNLNIQIFATTHSWDCIVAFQEALAQTRNGQDNLGMLFRLQERKGDIVAVDYDAEKLDVAVDHMIEVR